MAKSYCTDYVRHCLRFYSRYQTEPQFRTDIDEMNWRSAETVVTALPQEQKEIVIAIYGCKDTIADTIFNLAKEREMEQEELWGLVRKVEQDVATERKL